MKLNLRARPDTGPSTGHLTQRGGQQSSPVHRSLTARLNSGLSVLLTACTTFPSYWQSCLRRPAGHWKIYHTFAQISRFGNVERPWNSTVPSEHTPLIRKKVSGAQREDKNCKADRTFVRSRNKSGCKQTASWNLSQKGLWLKSCDCAVLIHSGCVCCAKVRSWWVWHPLSCLSPDIPFRMICRLCAWMSGGGRQAWWSGVKTESTTSADKKEMISPLYMPHIQKQINLLSCAS